MSTFGGCRVIAYGGQDGGLALTVSPSSPSENSKGGNRVWRTPLDGPISHLKFYINERLHRHGPPADTTDLLQEDFHADADADVNEQQLNLVVGVTVGYAIVFRFVRLFYQTNGFRDVTRIGFKDPALLPLSDQHDSVLAVGVLPPQPNLNLKQVETNI